MYGSSCYSSILVVVVPENATDTLGVGLSQEYLILSVFYFARTTNPTNKKEASNPVKATSTSPTMPLHHISSMDEYKAILETSKTKLVVIDFSAEWCVSDLVLVCARWIVSLSLNPSLSFGQVRAVQVHWSDF
jgi:thiol:disulfide interchange protein